MPVLRRSAKFFLGLRSGNRVADFSKDDIRVVFLFGKLTASIYYLVKFSFSEKATTICAIVLMVLTFKYLVNVKTMRKIVQIFVAFSEKLNFMYLAFSQKVRKSVSSMYLKV